MFVWPMTFINDFFNKLGKHKQSINYLAKTLNFQKNNLNMKILFDNASTPLLMRENGRLKTAIPTVTICLEFWWILFSPNGMFNNCSYLIK